MPKQTPSQQFASECGKIRTYVENDVPLGSLHDYLLNLKGDIVGRMVNAQKEEEAYAVKQTQESPKEC